MILIQRKNRRGWYCITAARSKRKHCLPEIPQPNTPPSQDQGSMAEVETSTCQTLAFPIYKHATIDKRSGRSLQIWNGAFFLCCSLQFTIFAGMSLDDPENETPWQARYFQLVCGEKFYDTCLSVWIAVVNTKIAGQDLIRCSRC